MTNPRQPKTFGDVIADLSQLPITGREAIVRGLFAHLPQASQVNLLSDLAAAYHYQNLEPVPKPEAQDLDRPATHLSVAAAPTCPTPTHELVKRYEAKRSLFNRLFNRPL